MTTRTGLAAAVVRSWRLSKDVRDLERIKRFIDLHPAYCHLACREAAAMTAWELGQNLAKYGIEDDDGGSGTMTVEIGTRITRIRTVNLAEADHDAEAVMTTVARLSSVRAAAELYRSRVVSLLEQPVQARARLGLLRTAFEGAFRLSAFRDGAYLEIDAVRRCEAGIDPSSTRGH